MARTVLRRRRDNAGRRVKAGLLIAAASLLATAAGFEARSQLRSGRPAPIQLPPLTTPALIVQSPADKQAILQHGLSPTRAAMLAAQARARLASEPLDASALWLWSLAQHRDTARRALVIADAVSRRDLPSQLASMRSTAEAGDLAQSILHLDRALTVLPQARDAILPAFARSAGLAELRALLQPYERRPWFVRLIVHATGEAPSARDAAALLDQGTLGAGDIAPAILPPLLGRLVVEGDFARAERLAARFAGTRPGSPHEFAPDAVNTAPAARPLSWTLADSGAASGELTPSGIRFAIEPGQSERLLARTTAYPPGDYTLAQTTRASGDSIRLVWTMRCRSGRRTTAQWSQRVPALASPGRYETRVAIPAACPVQSWTADASRSGGAPGATLDIEELQLRR